MTVFGKGGSEALEGGHVDCVVRLHGGGDRFLHIVEEARARGGASNRSSWYRGSGVWSDCPNGELLWSERTSVLEDFFREVSL